MNTESNKNFAVTSLFYQELEFLIDVKTKAWPNSKSLEGMSDIFLERSIYTKGLISIRLLSRYQ